MLKSSPTRSFLNSWNIEIVVLILFTISSNNVYCRAPLEPYYGRYIGPFTEFAHGIKGDVYAVDESTIFIKGFAYDGTGPDAFFWVGKTPRPSPEGYIIPYPEEYTGRDPPVLQAHNNTDIILRLPMGKRIRDIRWLSVWCRRFTVDFGEVFIPVGLDVPKPRVLPEFKRLAHGLRSSNISVLDAKTFYIPNLHYDGAGPDAYFWIGNGSEPNIMGTKVPNEMGSLDPLRGYQGEDIEIQLPGNLTVYDIDWLAVWCVQYKHNFGHVFIPKDLDVPPALGQTKITPPWWYSPTTTSTVKPPLNNCKELLSERLQVKWELQGDGVVIELIGRIREDEYMAFGLSGHSSRSQMVSADVVVAFYDKLSRVFRAEDYFISQLAQCDGQRGVCPDERLGGQNDVVVLSADRKNGVTSIKYKRPLQTNDSNLDRSIEIGRDLAVIAAIGPLNSKGEANAHSHDGKGINNEDIRIDFSSRVDNDCAVSLYSVRDVDAPTPWKPRRLIGVKEITVRIGPTGGKRGYTPITGIPSWGIAWYLNDELIPELYVERGETYTFIVEGGNNPQQSARYHPFYITDSNEGGIGQISEDHIIHEKYFAGIIRSREGYLEPTAAGRYCEWQHKTVDKSAEIETFEEYKKTLQLFCEDGQPAILNWTVPMDAPDLLYYQCFIHRNLGWKIIVGDKGANPKEINTANISTILSLPILFTACFVFNLITNIIIS